MQALAPRIYLNWFLFLKNVRFKLESTSAFEDRRIKGSEPLLECLMRKPHIGLFVMGKGGGFVLKSTAYLSGESRE